MTKKRVFSGPRRRPDKGIEYEVVSTDPHSSFSLFSFHVPTVAYYWHYHPEIELTLVVQGRGTRIVGDSVENYENGDLCLLGSNLAHCMVSDPAQRSLQRAIVIQFLPGFLGEKIFEAPEFRAIRQLLVRAKRGLRIEGETRDTVARKMLGLERLPAGHWQRIPALLSILGLLGESAACAPLATDRPEPATDRSDRDKINQVLEITNVPTADLPSQKKAAERVRLSPAAFSRFFKRHIGKTYVDYVIDLRVATVCRSLIDNQIPITEIAFAAGFESLSNFNRQFRKRKGMSPQNWRNIVSRNSHG